MDILNAQDYDVSEVFKSEPSAPKTPTAPEDKKKKLDIENSYFKVIYHFCYFSLFVVVGSSHCCGV